MTDPSQIDALRSPESDSSTLPLPMARPASEPRRNDRKGSDPLALADRILDSDLIHPAARRAALQVLIAANAADHSPSLSELIPAVCAYSRRASAHLAPAAALLGFIRCNCCGEFVNVGSFRALGECRHELDARDVDVLAALRVWKLSGGVVRQQTIESPVRMK